MITMHGAPPEWRQYQKRWVCSHCKAEGWSKDGMVPAQHDRPDRRAVCRIAESYWTYQSSDQTPALAEAIAAGAISADTTDQDWHKLSPGMRREILRQASRAAGR